MKVTDIKIGTRLELEIFDDLNAMIKPSFPSRLELPIDENTAIIAAPIREGVIYPVRINWFMNVYFIRNEDLYEFSARIISRSKKDNLSFLKIGILSDIIKLQRREYFRLECMVAVKYRVVKSLSEKEENKEPMKSAITSDLSGGGLCIKLEEKLNRDELIECILDLGEKEKVNFIGKIVRATTVSEGIKYKYEAGVIFHKIGSKDKEAIIRFIFREQSRLRRKGLI